MSVDINSSGCNFKCYKELVDVRYEWSLWGLLEFIVISFVCLFGVISSLVIIIVLLDRVVFFRDICKVGFWNKIFWFLFLDK